MLTKHKKISKKEMKEDQLVTAYYKFIDYFEKNQKMIYIAVGALVAIVAAIVLYRNYTESQNTEAGTALAKVLDVYDSGAFAEAVQGNPQTKVLGLKKIAEDYSGSENGEIAVIYLGNAYNALGKTEEAFKAYDDYSGDIDMFKAAALAGKAGYYAGKKEFEKAASLYLDASRIEKGNAMNSTYILNAGINYLDAGNKEKARELFNTIQMDYENTAANQEVDNYLPLVEE